MPPRIHFGALPNRPIADIANVAEPAGRLGRFAGIWVADSQSIFRDPFAALMLSATRTRSISLATAVTIPSPVIPHDRLQPRDAE